MNNEYKQALIDTGLFKKVPSRQHEYRANCPYCGDTHYHLYLHIDVTTDDAVVYMCKRCPNVHGALNAKLLNDLGIDIKIPKEVQSMKKLKVDEGVSETMNLITVDGNNNIQGVSEYINSRVGHRPTLQELQMFQYLGNPLGYAKEYLGEKNIDMLKNRYWFKMTNGNMCGRIRDDKLSSYRWLMYKSTRVTRSGLYHMKTPIDVLADINVCISEGVMDSIGLYYNYKELENCTYISVCSKQYSKGMYHMINRGIFGDSVNIHIFKDPNVRCEDIYIDPNMRRLFKNVFLYGNGDKDYGVLDISNTRRLEKR